MTVDQSHGIAVQVQVNFLHNNFALAIWRGAGGYSWNIWPAVQLLSSEMLKIFCDPEVVTNTSKRCCSRFLCSCLALFLSKTANFSACGFLVISITKIHKTDLVTVWQRRS